ncbi:unnamed protein product [Echinostoma caproni]|uniref:ANK_REP_REGION domain-containing protein n=1 Tax=Echinostoma caproni TaxID=27848 RepID=A0A183AK05_9TREM|nr:unnamed protein product [Echinostoma caproni]
MDDPKRRIAETLRRIAEEELLCSDQGPKNHEEDCALVTTTAPLHLNQSQVQLFEWAKSDRVDAISELIAQHRCNLNVQDNYNRTPLHFAASSGNLATVKLLVQNNAVIDVTDKYGITPLLWSVYNNHKKVAVYLIESGAKYNKVTKQGQTIVHFVAESNAIGILKYLYQKYHLLEIDKKDNAGLTPFMVAAFRGNELLLEVFIRQKCHVLNRDKDSDGKSALHYAIVENHQEVVRQLLSACADPNVESNTMDAPIIEASRRGYHSCIDILLSHGAQKDKRTKRGQTPLHLAVEQNRLETVEALLLAGAKLDPRDNDGLTPLEVAARASYTTLVDMIIKTDRWRQQYPVSVPITLPQLINVLH